MATTSKIVINYKGQNGDDIRFSYGYINPETPVATVEALVNGLIANNTLFENPPVTAVSAKLVTTTEDEYEFEA